MLSIYGFPACPFCARVNRVIEQLNAPVENRDIWRDPSFREELLAARGRGTVPVLRIEEGNDVTWLGESQDIIAYLQERFTDG